MRVHRLVLLALVCLALTACGGDKEAGRKAGGIGRAEFATDAAPTGVDVAGPKSGAGGIVRGEPRLQLEPATPPDEALGSERAGCSGTTLVPSPANAAVIASATLCLLNAERAARSLEPLRAQSLLRKAAVVHALDMIENSYFAHDSLDGKDFSVRIEHTGYLRGVNSYSVGENLAWGTDELSSPTNIVQAWMNSPGHRANILMPRFREIGVAIALGVPVEASGAGATYVTEFGARG